jgi:hypothetical protein
MNDSKIYVAFRFHVNFSHSFRGDTPDEQGFGKDIRIIRHIIKTLDRFNEQGIKVCGTWGCENYFSLQKNIPEHCPDIITDWKRRISEGRDEVQITSYNNGLVSAQTAKEFGEAISRSISNPWQSGVKDIFETFSPMVRPQEMMFTPIHLLLYPTHGIESISLYNSALPSNCFSNFVPPLSLIERFNPLTLKYQGIKETMTLMPAYNSGDLMDNLSLARWIKKIRKQQLALSDPTDLMVLIDMDADDEFWVRFDYPIINRYLSTLKGLEGMVKSLSKLDFVSFTTPGKYIETHETVGQIEIRQDTADGSFDGLSSWAEKWSNQWLWTGIERSRVLELQTLKLAKLLEEDDISQETKTLLDESFEERLLSMSTTHFGSSSPIMNESRLKAARELVESSFNKVRYAFQITEKQALKNHVGSDGFVLMDYNRGISTETITYPAAASRMLVKLGLQVKNEAIENLSLVNKEGKHIPFDIVVSGEKKDARKAQLYFFEQLNPDEEKFYRITTVESKTEEEEEDKIPLRNDIMENDELSCRFDDFGNITSLTFKGNDYLSANSLSSAVTYAKIRSEVSNWENIDFLQVGDRETRFRRMKSNLLLKAAGGKHVEYKRQVKLNAKIPYLYVDLTIQYPVTSFQKYNKERAEKLEKSWDGDWTEVIPCEINPAIMGSKHKHLRIWKHNYFGHVSSYDLNYADFSKNEELDAFNNQITHGWVAVSDGKQGLLIAQTVDALSSFAFCPMQTRKIEEEVSIHLNPFGSYYGRQFKYPTANTGIGKMAALMTSEHLDPYAPSFNGKRQNFSLMIAPYEGDAPPQELQNDALAFAYPTLLLSNTDLIKEPSYRNWSW